MADCGFMSVGGAMVGMPQLGGVCTAVGAFANAAPDALRAAAEGVNPAAGFIAHDGLEGVAQDTGASSAEFIMDSFTWWLGTPSASPNTPAVYQVQSYTMPVTVLLLMVGILVQCIRMVLQRKFQPAIEIGSGLVKYAATATLGVMFLSAALAAGDALTDYWLNPSIAQFSTKMTEMLAPKNGAFAIAAFNSKPILVMVLALLGLVLGAIQWVLLFLRQAGILVLAGLLPVTAAGAMTPATKQWLQRLLATVASLVVYKPLAALIYVIGMQLLGNGNDMSTFMTGLAIMAIALIALPTLLKFFSFAGASFSGGGGGGFLSNAAELAARNVGLGGGGGSGGQAEGGEGQQPAVDNANRMEATGPGTGPEGSSQPSGQSAGQFSGGPIPSGASGGGSGATGESPPPHGGAPPDQGSSPPLAEAAPGATESTATGTTAATANPVAGGANFAVQQTREGVQSAADSMTGGGEDGTSE